MPRATLDLAGQRFDRLVVLSSARKTPSGQVWLCACDCGGQALRYTSQLRSKPKLSIGCPQCEARRRADNSSLRTHGRCIGGKTKLYNVWKGMNGRCRDKGNTSFRWYGRLGVRVCKEWAESFDAFEAWAMATGYAAGLTIDRIDPSGNYEPANCRWATPSEQMRNQRRHT